MLLLRKTLYCTNKYSRKLSIVKNYEAFFHSLSCNNLSESSRNSSDDEPLIKPVKHPLVTKLLRIILEKCDGEAAGDTGTGRKTSTGTDYRIKSLLMLQ